eukprot:CAMPEP_0198261954 /NCGR_PEP_ID=MMETSP1447-20131203/10548_1 /TAXON_ID=420782 /ORGANISM="Chaetoceros dichaeta, Strain CCMP1751" /LENGTH=420 /DNA_ID=CAMNT_0043950013 /DNA_START=136 /DNA_END=1398 /DNA_ORIENTATION=-
MPNLIKNYIPLRVTLPPITPTPTSDEPSSSSSRDTFLFIKKHSSTTNTTTNTESRTLFIANAPFYPHIRTSILLNCLFEKYGDVEQVVVAPNPSKVLLEGGGVEEEEETILQTMFEKGLGGDGSSMMYGMALDENKWYCQGRFAHVKFTTVKQMKNVLATLTDDVSVNGNDDGEDDEGKKKKKKKKKKKGSGNTGHVQFKKLELQELQDISIKLFNKEKARFGLQYLKPNDDSDNDSDNNSQHDSDENSNNDETHTPPPNGLQALVQLHQNRIPPRALLKKITDQIMLNYETAENDARQTQLETKEGAPDDDGFITVSYTAAVGDRVAMEENGTLGSTGGGKGKGGGDRGAARGKRGMEAMRRARSTKGNLEKGSDELKDFYRFQLRESKKRGMEELKTRFEDDLRRVKRMKEQKMYRPF